MDVTSFKFIKDGIVFRHGDRVSVVADMGSTAKPLLGTLRAFDSPTGPELVVDFDEGSRMSWCLYANNEWLSDHSDLFHIDNVTKKKRAKRIKESLLPKTANQQEALAQAIASLKNSDYGVKYIKVELEGDAGSGPHTVLRVIEEHLEALNMMRYVAYLEVDIDGSVGGEGTEVNLTVQVDHPEVVVEAINAYNQLARGNGYRCVDNEGAGMHISVLNSVDGTYPHGNRFIEPHRQHFKAAMTPLLPALLFLASENYHSRGLGFRELKISRDKCSAIHEVEGAYEFRIFETCYQHPERFYDFLSVIANAMQFYSDKPMLPHFAGKIGKLGFIDRSDEGVGRYYYTYAHYEALREGIKILGPTYKSFDRLKKERNYVPKARELRRKDKAFEAEVSKGFLDARREAVEQRRAMRKAASKKEYEKVILDGLEREQDPYRASQYSFRSTVLAKLKAKEMTAEDIAKEAGWLTFEEWRRRQLAGLPPIPQSIKRYLRERKAAYYIGYAGPGNTVEV